MLRVGSFEKGETSKTFSITFHIVYGIISCASFIQSALYSLIYVATGRIVSCLLKEGRERAH